MAERGNLASCWQNSSSAAGVTANTGDDSRALGGTVEYFLDLGAAGSSNTLRYPTLDCGELQPSSG